MDELIFTQPDDFERQKQRLLRGGASELKVLADFDGTLTTKFIHGRKVPTLIGALREGNYLSDDYNEKAQALYDYYKPFESDLTLALDDKKDLMTEWWRKHFQLLIDSGLCEENIADVVDNRLANLRPGVVEFLSILAKNNIPLFIFSASGLGISGLKYFLMKRGLWSENIILVANDFIWGKNGKATGVKEPIIHSFNKDETMLAKIGLEEKLSQRSNVILLGDSLGDAHMDAGLTTAAVLKIAFVNDKIRESVPLYREVYDALILNDGDFTLPLEILKEVINYAN